MRSDKGWISLSKKIFNPDKQTNEFCGDGPLITIWATLIAWANWRDSKRKLKLQRVVVKRGQLATSIAELSSFTGYGSSIVRRRLAYLEQTHRITHRKTNYGSIITICKYDDYQSAVGNVDTQIDKPIDTQTTRRRHAGDTQASTSEQVNNITNKQEYNIPEPKGPAPSRLVSIWNENRGSLPEVQKVSKSRERKIRVRLTEEPDLSYWESLVKKMAANPFLRGENDRGWAATFDWLVANDTNHVKVSEGRYESAKPTADDWLPEPLPNPDTWEGF